MNEMSDFGIASRRQLFTGAGVAAAAALTSSVFGSRAEAMMLGSAQLDGAMPVARLNLRENPFGPSPMAVKAIVEAAGDANRYAGDEKLALINYIAAMYSVDPSMVMLSNGSKPTLSAMGAVWGNKRGDMVTADSTYGILYQSAAAFGANLVQVPLTESYDWDYQTMITKVGAKTSGIYLCNPNGTTGRLSTPEEMKAFIIEASKYAPVFVDETYLDMTDDAAARTMIPLAAAGYNVVVSRTLSKLHGLAGQRLGYAIGPKAQLDPVRALLTDHVNRAACVAGLASLKDTKNQAMMRVKLAAGRKELESIFTSLDLPYVKGAVFNGVMVDFKKPVAAVSDKLKAKRILIGGRGTKEKPTWTSICVGTPTELALFKPALGEALQMV